jgi:hypothetical protein
VFVAKARAGRIDIAAAAWQTDPDVAVTFLRHDASAACLHRSGQRQRAGPALLTADERR